MVRMRRRRGAWREADASSAEIVEGVEGEEVGPRRKQVGFSIDLRTSRRRGHLGGVYRERA